MSLQTLILESLTKKPRNVGSTTSVWHDEQLKSDVERVVRKLRVTRAAFIGAAIADEVERAEKHGVTGTVKHVTTSKRGASDTSWPQTLTPALIGRIDDLSCGIGVSRVSLVSHLVRLSVKRTEKQLDELNVRPVVQ